MPSNDHKPDAGLELADGSPDWGVTDPRACILAVNQAFTRSVGCAQSAVLGQTPRIPRSGRHDRGFNERLWASVLIAGQWRGAIWNRRKDGDGYPE